jgi:hypothetical protein
MTKYILVINIYKINIYIKYKRYIWLKYIYKYNICIKLYLKMTSKLVKVTESEKERGTFFNVFVHLAGGAGDFYLTKIVLCLPAQDIGPPIFLFRFCMLEAGFLNIK